MALVFSFMLERNEDDLIVRLSHVALDKISIQVVSLLKILGLHYFYL